MIQVILATSILYLIQLMLPGFLKKRAGDKVAERAAKALHNLRESLPVFFTFAVLSITLDINANLQIAIAWIVFRVLFVVLYSSGINTRPANASGYEAQPIRSLVWVLSIACLIAMGANLA
jgi:uncharacterized MAPEG superfamily protein